MNEEASSKVRLLAVAVILGILADALLHALPWGLNVFLWVFVLVGFIVWTGRDKAELWTGGGAWLVLPSVFFAWGFVWRDSAPLAALDLFALWVTASLAVLRAQGGRILASGLADYARGGVIASFNALLGGPFLILKEVRWQELFGGRWSGRAMALGRGLLLALPPAILFGVLFASADPLFARLVREAFHFDFPTLVSHAFLFGFFAWTSAGLLRGLLCGKELNWAKEHRPQAFSLGTIEVNVVLGVIDLIFLIFVAVQVRYLFGGASLVEATIGLTYAEYARLGFFELVVASALVLPLLLGSHWILGKDSAHAERIYRALAGLLIGLVFVVLASAIDRMRLYQAEYGMTELRFYATGFMAWLAAVFVWFAVTVLAGRRQRFAGGALVAGYILIAVLHALNPDAMIARVNTTRASEGRRFDARYTASLGAGAVPELIAALPALPPPDRCVIRERLFRRWSNAERADWRTWSFDRQQARDAVRESLAMLSKMSCPDTKVQGLPQQ